MKDNPQQSIARDTAKIMVAVSTGPDADFLIRWTKQRADEMKADWIGVSVDTGRAIPASEIALLSKNTQLIRELGGEFATIQNSDLVSGILKVAYQNHVTHIVLGKTHRSMLWNFVRGGSLFDRLLAKCGAIDLIVVGPSAATSIRPVPPRNAMPIKFSWNELGWTISIVFSFWFLASFLNPAIGYHAVGIVFLMSVVLSGMFLSSLSVLLIAILVSLIHNFFFIPPLHTFAIHEPHDLLMNLMFFLAAATIGHLTTRLKRQNTFIEEREDRAILLFNLAHSISRAKNVEEVVLASVKALERTFAAEVAIILYSPQGDVKLHGTSTFLPATADMDIALWVKDHLKPAGKYTEFFSSQATTFLPLCNRTSVMGVVGLKFSTAALQNYDHLELAQALTGQIAAGLEREILHESRKRLELLEQADKLFRTLFDSVSHELKTPLTTLKGAAHLLMAQPNSASPDFVHDLAIQMGSETDRLLAIVDNMLDMTRLESGALKPKIELYDIADILGPSLKWIHAISKGRQIQTKVAPDINPILCDAPLVVQALSNILHNAVAHTPDDKFIEIGVLNSPEGTVSISVTDGGPGLPSENPRIVFDKFYREKPSRGKGVGLGLSIARGFIEAQGGKLTCTNNPRGGAIFTITLPAG